MDTSKLTALRQAGFVIPQTCGLCLHGQFSSPTSEFGTCNVLTYDHEKHTGPARHLSVYRHGGCRPLFSLDPEKEKQLGKWAEFIERRKFTRSNRHKSPTRY